MEVKSTVDCVLEGLVTDHVAGEAFNPDYAPLLMINPKQYLLCGALVNMGLMGKRVRVTVEVLEDSEEAK